jgi:dTDP-4-dehydrorhamnose reductase
MRKILVTGANGQLGSELKYWAAKYNMFEYVLADRAQLDVTKKEEVIYLFDQHKFDYVINCAAYTAVDKAETEKDLAYKINVDAAACLADACKAYNAKLVHISTDFIFDGTIARPLLETDKANPLSVYGASKWEGEELVAKTLPHSLIIRTSWVYSSYGSNFVKTVLRLCRERDTLNMIYDQVGTPTYARDLARFILDMLANDNWHDGVYNYSNEGVCSWYDFAIAIRDFAGLTTQINPIETHQYPTPAIRPKYSVLNKAKIKSTFNVEIPYWRNSLYECVELLK